MRLKEYNFKTDYNKVSDDIASEFYLPCMRNSVKYDRITGYFGSTIYLIAWSAIKSFISNSGKMRIICSPEINESDKNALDEGYSSRFKKNISDTLRDEIEKLLENDYLSTPSRALACLVSQGILDIKIAIIKTDAPPTAKRIFHDKVGIFQDKEGSVVGFRGSMNETYNGLASDGNIESIDVFPNWIDNRDKKRVENAINYFNKLWENEINGVEVFDFPEAAKKNLTKYVKDDKLEDLIKKIKGEINLAEYWTPENKKEKRTPRPHQVKALEVWRNNDFKGILEHATGSGKTFTAICAIKNSFEYFKTPLILVPSKELLMQWEKELREVFFNQSVVIFSCGDENTSWKKPGYLSSWSLPNHAKKVIILSTMDTAASEGFLKQIQDGEHIFLVADEVHRLGSPYRRKALNLASGFRLGLSATPRRFGDEEGTQSIFNYFGKIIPPPFSLKDAIDTGVLTKYFYYPQEIKLNEKEEMEWLEISKKISIISAKELGISSDTNFSSNNPFLQNLFIKRARIIKNASGKISLAKQIVKNHFKEGQKWLVYCDNQVQLNAVLVELNSLKLDVFEYHSSMAGDRIETLRYFNSNGGILVSIKCLDEGVDIPAATHALILASSKNPREFIQRRGRILRKSKNKPFAYLFDAIVTPSVPKEDGSKQTSIIESELARAIQFGSWAENPACISKLKNIAIDFNINLNEALNGGYEDEKEL